MGSFFNTILCHYLGRIPVKESTETHFLQQNIVYLQNLLGYLSISSVFGKS